MRSVAAFLRDIQNDFILDLNIVPGFGQLFPRRVMDLATFHLAKKPSSRDIVKACEERQCILVTTDPSYEIQLRKDNGTSWGLLLLSEERAAQEEFLRRLWSDEFRFKVKKKQQIVIPKASKILINLRVDVLAMELFGSIEFKELITYGRAQHPDSPHTDTKQSVGH
jgi:hypothetical protein